MLLLLISICFFMWPCLWLCLWPFLWPWLWPCLLPCLEWLLGRTLLNDWSSILSTSSDISLRSVSRVSSTISSLRSTSSSSWELSKRWLKFALGRTVSIVMKIRKDELMCVHIFVGQYQLSKWSFKPIYVLSSCKSPFDVGGNHPELLASYWSRVITDRPLVGQDLMIWGITHYCILLRQCMALHDFHCSALMTDDNLWQWSFVSPSLQIRDGELGIELSSLRPNAQG